MAKEESLLDAIHRLVAADPRYPTQAYIFIYQALEYSQRMVGEKRHVSGQELCEGVRLLAVDLFGPLAQMVFHHWGMRRTEDVGIMVFNLVAADLMGKTDDDCLDDFRDVYAFEEAFHPDNLLAQVDAKTLAPPSYKGPTRNLSTSDRAKVSL